MAAMPTESTSSLDGVAVPPGPLAGGRLGRLGRWCATHPWPVLGAWVLVLILATLGNHAFGGTYSDNFTLPNSPSEQGLALLKAHDPRQGGQGGQLVFTVSSGKLSDGADRSAIDTALTKVSHTPHVLSVSDPFSTGTVSSNGRTALATVHFDTNPQQLGRGYVTQMNAAVAPARSAGVSVNYGGALGQAASPKSKDGASSLIGIAIALLVLLIGFGSVYAAGLPLLTAGLATIGGIGVLGILAASSTFPKVSPTFATMMGLGVGIDYALFLSTRYRQRLIDGSSPHDAVAQALQTSGRAVLVAATTVVVALLSLYVSGISFMGELGLAGAVAVTVGALAALTLVPAVLGLLGARIDRHQLRAPAAESTADSAGWGHYARRVGTHPWRFLIGGVALLCVLAIPFFSMRLGHVDAGASSTNSTAKRAYDEITSAFGQGANGPYTIAVQLAPGTSSAEVQALEGKLHRALAATPDVSRVGPVHSNSSGDVLVATLIPSSSPQEQATDTLQTTLRDQTLPSALAGSGAKGYVTGSTSEQLDFRNQIASRLPVIVAVVVAIAFLLLLLNFRSPVLALKAAALNLLSIGAAYGVIVAVFQWGWGSSLIGVSEKIPIESYVPMLMFAIVFGLSMDYEVFLLSRVREAWLRTGDNHASVAAGLAATARVITCAALIMTGVFLAFMLSTNIVIKMLALGLGASILIDATVIRLVVVPAAMFLLGSYNWWTPEWLERLLPGGPPRPSDTVGAPGDGQRARAPRSRRERRPDRRRGRLGAGIAAAVLAVAVLAAFAVTFATTSPASSQAKTGSGKRLAGITATVAAGTVKDRSLRTQLTLAGTVGSASGAAQIAPQTPGTVTSLKVSAGQHVSAGQVVAQLSDTQGLHAKQAAAQGQLAQAQAALDGAEHPQSQPSSVAQAKTQLAEAKSALAEAQHPQSQAASVAQAKTQLAEAKDALAQAQHPQSSATSVAQAQEQVASAQTAVDDAEQKQSDDEAAKASAAQLSQDATTVSDAQSQLSAAQQALTTVENPPPASPQVITADETAVSAAQQALTSLEHPSGAGSDVISADQAEVKAAQQALSSLERPQPASGQAVTADEAAVSAAQNNLSAADQAVGQLTVRAPVAGTIAQILVPVGGYAAPTTPIASLAGATETVTAQASPNQVMTLQGHTGARAAVSLSVPGAHSNANATLTQIAPSANANTQQTTVTFATTAALQPGAPVDIAVQLPNRRGPVVPSDAIIESGGHEGVYVLTNVLNPAALGIKLPAGTPVGVEVGRATFKPVKTGISANGTTRILSGLSTGETVVTTGQTDLSASKPERVAILPTGTSKKAKAPATGISTAKHPGASPAGKGIDVTIVAVHGSMLTVSTPIGNKTFTVPAGFSVTHAGKPIALSQLHAGDVLKVTLARVNGKLTPTAASLQ